MDIKLDLVYLFKEYARHLEWCPSRPGAVEICTCGYEQIMGKL
jgi:hypothetical protein